VRADSDSRENRNVSKDKFQQELSAGRIKPWWERRLGDDEDAHHFYGFERVNKKDTRTRLFLGNNALVGANTPQIQRFIQKSLIVIVRADPAIRGERLDERLPGMDSAERVQRIADGLGSLDLLKPQGIVTLDTSNQDERDSQQAFAEIVLGHVPAKQPTYA
jgi:ribose 1,5-bisphosphokinase PhnN